MTELADLRSYHDLGKVLSKPARSQAMAYLAWHNRLTMTPILHPWQALVVGKVAETHTIDTLFYSSIKTFFDSTYEAPVQTIADCDAIARKLETVLFGSEAERD